MRGFIYSASLVALLAGCDNYSDRPSSSPVSPSASSAGPSSVNCENQAKARHGAYSADCSPGVAAPVPSSGADPAAEDPQAMRGHRNAVGQ